MYYIYTLKDPRNDKIFYIGKGKNNRDKEHLAESNIKHSLNKRKSNKIQKIQSLGLEVVVEHLIDNIEDEKLAYDIEATLIKQYGRKGYDKNGILLNICSDARPPNHKGKTYEDIYGIEGAKIQRAKRAQLQKQRGGYGPKKHSEETKLKLSIASKAQIRKPFSEERKQKISQANKGRTQKNSSLYHFTNLITNKTSTVQGILQAKEFCKLYNLSWDTFAAYKNTDKQQPYNGRNQNWIFRFEQK